MTLRLDARCVAVKSLAVRRPLSKPESSPRATPLHGVVVIVARLRFAASDLSAQSVMNDELAVVACWSIRRRHHTPLHLHFASADDDTEGHSGLDSVSLPVTSSKYIDDIFEMLYLIKCS